MGKTLAIDTKTNEYCFYDKDEIVDIQDTKFIYVSYIKDGSGLLIKYERLEDVVYDHSECDNDGFDYKGAYLQQVNVNEELRSRVESLENILSNGVMLKNELNEYEGDPVESIDDVDPSDPADNDIRLKILRDNNIKLGEKINNLGEEINKLHLEKESLMMQLSDCKMLQDRITELEEMLFDKRNEDKLSDVVKDHEDRITRLENILNDTSKKGGGSDDNRMIGYKKYDYMPYSDYVITRTNAILI